MYTDNMTASRRRIRYARVCVEVNAAEDLVKEFDLMGENGDWFTIYVEYDWIPAICKSCKVFGHSTTTCSKVSNKVLASEVGVSEPSQEGDWVRVQRKGKGKVAVTGSGANKEKMVIGNGSTITQLPEAHFAAISSSEGDVGASFLLGAQQGSGNKDGLCPVTIVVEGKAVVLE